MWNAFQRWNKDGLSPMEQGWPPIRKVTTSQDDSKLFSPGTSSTMSPVKIVCNCNECMYFGVPCRHAFCALQSISYLDEINNYLHHSWRIKSTYEVANSIPKKNPAINITEEEYNDKINDNKRKYLELATSEK